VLPALPPPVWPARRPHGTALRGHEAEVLAFLKPRYRASTGRSIVA
jgi:hypothetical protein